MIALLKRKKPTLGQVVFGEVVEPIRRPFCLADDVPVFQDFRREMARTGAPVQSLVGYYDSDTYAGRADLTTVWLGRLAVAERITPSGYVYRDPTEFIAQFGDWPGSWKYWECDLIQVIADARNWRPATAEDAARRRIVHAAARSKPAFGGDER